MAGNLSVCISASVVEVVSGGGGWKIERLAGEAEAFAEVVSLGRTKDDEGEAAWMDEAREWAVLRPCAREEVVLLELLLWLP